MGRPSAGRKKQVSTPRGSPELWQGFMSAFGNAPFTPAEDSAAAPGRAHHLETEASQMASNLRETLHSEAYRDRLAGAWSALVSWFSANFFGWSCEDILANLSCAILILCRYIQHIYGMGHKVTLGVETVLSVQNRFRAHRGHLCEVWDMIVSWKKELPLRLRTPLPEALVLAISRWALARGLGSSNSESCLWTRFGVGLRVAFYALLRPGELCTLTRLCVSLPQGCLTLEGSSPRAVLVIIAPKNWRFAGRHQTAYLDDQATISWLAWMCEGLSDLSLVFPSLHQMRRLLAIALDALHLQGLNICLASLRAGGATELFKKTHNLPIVQYAGRWASVRTLLHYIQEASSSQALLQLPLEARACVIWLRENMRMLDRTPRVPRAAIFDSTSFREVRNPPPALLHLISHWQACGRPWRQPQQQP